MSSDDSTTLLPTGDAMSQLLLLVKGMDARLRSLEEKVDARLHDTRPIWETVQSQLKEIGSDVREMKRNIRVLNDNMLNIQGSQRELEDRVDRLEEKAS